MAPCLPSLADHPRRALKEKVNQGRRGETLMKRAVPKTETDAAIVLYFSSDAAAGPKRVRLVVGARRMGHPFVSSSVRRYGCSPHSVHRYV